MENAEKVRGVERLEQGRTDETERSDFMIFSFSLRIHWRLLAPARTASISGSDQSHQSN
jgi:hypothetical protein